MTTKEIISLLRRGMFSDTLLRLAADTIEKLESENNRQKAEIERLKHYNIAMAQHALILCRENYKEGVKDFAKRFENKLTQIEEIYIDEDHENFISANKVISLLVNLVKEMERDSDV